MIDNMYTIAELDDLLAAKDVEMGAIDKEWKAWVTGQPTTPEIAQWQSDYNGLFSRYAAAKSDANTAISLAEITVLPNTAIPADAQYKEVLRALQQTDGVVSQGDFQDLWNRLTSMTGAPIPEPPVPQPTKGSDLDLTAYQGATAVTKVVDKGLAAAQGVNWTHVAVVGAVALGAGVVIASKVLKPI